MRALRLVAPREVQLIDVPVPEPGPNEVLVRIAACGVCGSDLNAWRGAEGIEYPLPPGAPGHETWGEVQGVGNDATGWRIGELVTGLMWNGLAEYGVGRAEHLLRIPARLQAQPPLGEPLACAMNVVRRAQLRPGQHVAMVGFGYLASLIVHLMPEDVRWVAISRREDSRVLADRLGAEGVYDFSNVPDSLWDSHEVVIEAAGVQQTLDYATWLTAYAGRLVVAGYHADGMRTVNMQSWNWKGIDVINAHARKPATYMTALRDAFELLERRPLAFATLHKQRWALSDARDAFEAAETRPAGFVKALVCP